MKRRPLCPGCGRNEQQARSGLCKECTDVRKAVRAWEVSQDTQTEGETE